MSQYTGIKQNEIFLGNVPVSQGIPDYLISAGFQTLRLGDKALDLNGDVLSTHLPMFIHRDEAKQYDRIMMKRTFPDQHYWG